MSTATGNVRDRVRAWARGIYPTEAGVELLIRHGRAIYDGAPWILELDALDLDRQPMAAVDVDRLLDGAGAWSGGERRVVDLAVSLIDGRPVDLSEAVSGLDRSALALVLGAIAHANGSHEHSGVVYDDTGRPRGFTRLESLYPWPDQIDQGPGTWTVGAPRVGDGMGDRHPSPGFGVSM